MRIKKRVQGTEDRLFRTRIGYPNHLRVMRKIQSLEDYYRAGPSSEKLLIDTENISNALAWAWRHVPVDTLLEKLKQGDLELCACARTCVVLTHALRKDGPSHVCECPPPHLLVVLQQHSSLPQGISPSVYTRTRLLSQHIKPLSQLLRLLVTAQLFSRCQGAGEESH